MKIPTKRKGMNDIKTHAGTVDRTFLPHKAFMRISCLEMEKAHRVRERESARQRIKTINNRIKEIEAEKEILLNHIKNAGGNSMDEKDSIQRKKTDDRDNKPLLLRY